MKVIKKKVVRKSKNKYKNKSTGKFRSGLEEFCDTQLKLNKIDFKYEEWKVELFPKFKSSIVSYESKAKALVIVSPNIRNMTYTPDFVGDNWIIETKGRETPDFKIKWKMFKKYLEDNNLEYTLFKPTNQKQVLETIKIISTFK